MILLRCISYIVLFDRSIYINYQQTKCAFTEGQQTSGNFCRPMLHRHKKPLHQ